MTDGAETDWSIQEVARLTGLTSRALRHYQDVGLLTPSRVAAGGIRHYDQAALVRLQRIMLLRELGLGIPAIAEVLDGRRDDAAALRGHLAWLARERDRLDRQIASVETTIEHLEGGERLMAAQLFDGFDHTAHEAEVTERWGAEAYRSGDAWLRGMSEAERADWRARTTQLAADWQAAAAAGVAPHSAEAQALAQRHADWLGRVPGTPAADGDALDYIRGLGDLYVADPRFGADYGGEAGATFVRDALHAWADAGE